MENKKIGKKKLRRQQKYDEMIKHPNTGSRNWLKEKPYQLIYEERMKHEQRIKQEKEEDAAAGL